jgi:hypothetical protein
VRRCRAQLEIQLNSRIFWNSRSCEEPVFSFRS